jgi:glycosyltransferase involved in cell wall biosynthesis
MAKIVTVYSSRRRLIRLIDMSFIRWWKISAGLARLGHEVDMATNEWRWLLRNTPESLAPNLRKVPLARVRWGDYDIVKTLFHSGFDTLCRYGGGSHPFIISKLGSVVGPKDMEGIYFYGERRRQLFETQRVIARTSTYVTVLSPSAGQLWRDCFGASDNILLLPGAADASIPPPGRDPYPDRERYRCIFSGNIYTRKVQPEANAVLVDKLNRLGRLLAAHDIRLYLLGPGDVRGLEREAVTYLGFCDYNKSWDYLHYAQVGVVVTGGGIMHNNESTKIYHYLRAGLPVVSEAGFPNDDVVHKSGLGFVVTNGDLALLADKVLEAATREWDREAAVNFILKHHTWDARVAVYDRIIRQNRS